MSIICRKQTTSQNENTLKHEKKMKEVCIVVEQKENVVKISNGMGSEWKFTNIDWTSALGAVVHFTLTRNFQNAQFEQGNLKMKVTLDIV